MFEVLDLPIDRIIEVVPDLTRGEAGYRLEGDGGRSSEAKVAGADGDLNDDLRELRRAPERAKIRHCVPQAAGRGRKVDPLGG